MTDPIKHDTVTFSTPIASLPLTPAIIKKIVLMQDKLARLHEQPQQVQQKQEPCIVPLPVILFFDLHSGEITDVAGRAPCEHDEECIQGKQQRRRQRRSLRESLG